MSRFYPVSKLIAPIFIDQQTFFSTADSPGQALQSIPGFSRLSGQQALCQIESLWQSGIESILIYPLLERSTGTACGNPSERISEDFFLLPFVRQIKERFPELHVILDLCLCHFSDVGQCGVIEHLELANDLTLAALQQLALLYASAGADALMLSGMIDGAVNGIRHCLDHEGFTATALMVQSAKLDSSLYGPFQKLKHAPVGQPLKSTYHADPANSAQMRRELLLDLEEGADIFVLKPIMNSIDLLPTLDQHQRPPIFGYMTGGEYALLRESLPDDPHLRLEGLNRWLRNLERAGLDAIFCYIAEEYAHLLGHSARQING